MFKVKKNIEKLILEERKSTEIQKDLQQTNKFNDVAPIRKKNQSKLNTWGYRVTMKIDVSHPDHPYIIGNSGKNIKYIMKHTDTHIHFPDMNLISEMHKSNLVSLFGSLEGMEQARALVRLSAPLSMSFQIPPKTEGKPKLDNNTPYIKKIAKKFKVAVNFESINQKSTLVSVNGSEMNADKLQEATKLLMEFICGKDSNILVRIKLEMIPHNQKIIQGNNNENLMDIMERTKTEIQFCYTELHPIRRLSVFITGTSIEGIYKAKQQLLGNLPVVLRFNLADHRPDATELMNLSNKYGLFISKRRGKRSNLTVINIKGVEKFIDKMYEACQEILCLKTNPIKPEIPELYFSPNDHQKLESLDYRRSLSTLLSGYQNIPYTRPNDYNIISSYAGLQETQNYHLNSPIYISSEDNFLGQQQLSNVESLELEGTAAGLGAEEETYRNQNFDLWQQVLDFDIKIGFETMEPAPIINDELSAQNVNWIGLERSDIFPAPLLETNEDNVWKIVSEYAAPSADQYAIGDVASTKEMPISSTLMDATIGIIDSTPYDLIQMGIKAFGTSKGLHDSINSIEEIDDAAFCIPTSSNSSLAFSGSVAPGAERRRTSNGFKVI